MPATIRISPAAHQSLTKMARETNSTLQEILDQAIENQRRRLLLERANRGYAKLRQDKKAWEAWRAELRQLDATLSDGI
jgi:mRNA-degrading endonuclease RelE of RelBE toxin-antitoxin system